MLKLNVPLILQPKYTNTYNNIKILQKVNKRFPKTLTCNQNITREREQKDRLTYCHILFFECIL